MLPKVLVTAAPVRQQVVTNLRTAIYAEHFKPGTRLIERELCELLGVSRSSVREALRQLEAEGLIQTLTKGPVVASVAPDQLREIFEARGALEGLSARLFAERATVDQVSKLENIMAQLEQTLETGDWNLLLQHKSRYYEILAEGSHNSIITTQQRNLRLRLTLQRGKAVVRWKEWQARESVSEVRCIVEAIRRRDGLAAQSASVAHTESAMRRALSVLQEELVARETARRAG